MRTVNSDRIFGKVEELHPTFGYVRGDDGRQYFFLPSYVQSPHDFIDLCPGMCVCFLVLAHPRGLRATSVTVTEESTTHAETDSQPAHR